MNKFQALESQCVVEWGVDASTVLPSTTLLVLLHTPQAQQQHACILCLFKDTLLERDEESPPVTHWANQLLCAVHTSHTSTYQHQHTPNLGLGYYDTTLPCCCTCLCPCRMTMRVAGSTAGSSRGSPPVEGVELLEASGPPSSCWCSVRSADVWCWWWCRAAWQ